MALFSVTKCLFGRCAALATLLLLLTGCGQGPQITQYEVPKEPTPDRMLAALVPHGSEAWSFKLAGPGETVGKHTEKFDALVQTVTFPDSTAGEPQWKLPEGWTQEAGGAQMRFATIRIPDSPPLELTMAKVSWESGAERQEILANVNRWRGQMQLPPIGEEDLSDETRSLKLTADQSKAIVVDLAGRLKTGGMSPPFASATGKGDLPAGHPPVGEKTTGAKSGGGESGGAKKATQVAADPNLPFSFDLPAGWHPAPLKTFSVATFAVEKDAQKVEITATPFGGGAGGLLNNVNR